MAGLDQQALLAKLQQLNIAHENHAHGAVMTCDAQVRSLRTQMAAWRLQAAHASPCSLHPHFC